MKSAAVAVAMGMIATGMPLRSNAETAASAGTPVQKIVVAALVKDAPRAAEIEADLTGRFTKRGAQASGLRSLFPQSAAVPHMIERMRAAGFDHVLCLAPVKAIRLTPADSASKAGAMESCLKMYASDTFPEGEPVDFSAVREDRPRPAAVPSTPMSAPIPTTPAAAPIRVVKGSMRLYELASGKLRWQGTAQAKVPEELQTDLQLKLILEEAWRALDGAGFLPKQ